MKILKFGEAALAGTEAVHGLVRVVRESQERIVVIPAFPGAMRMLEEASQAARSGGDWLSRWNAIREQHRSMMHALLQGTWFMDAESAVDERLGELKSILYGISLVRDLSGRTQDLVASFGPMLSAIVIARVLSQEGIPAQEVDSRSIIVTDCHYGSAHWDEARTRERISASFATLMAQHHVTVVPGSIASSIEGAVTMLGRAGDDLTASILAHCLGAEEIQIWSEVDGIMTADRLAVPDAFAIPEISFTEALEMSHFGAHVLHPVALVPAMEKAIPIRIRNLFNPEAPGTRIVKHAAPSPYPVRGLASIPDVSLVLLQGPGLPGVSGIAARMFDALARVKANVILITQGSSELSICVAVLPSDAVRGAQALREEFSQEIEAGTIAEPAMEHGLSIIAVVGEMMKHRVGISGRVFKALGRNGINVVAIAQGSSELNISIVTSAQDRAKAMCAIHDAFFLAGVRTVNVFLVGAGLIGSTLLSQIASQNRTLLQHHSIRLRVAGIANSRRMCIDAEGIDPAAWKEALDCRGEPSDLECFVREMKRLNLPNACFCDCTASDAPLRFYEEILESSISIVTPNKRANSGPLARYQALLARSRFYDVPYRYETTVGAGLPVIGTIQDLVASGDRILRIEAVLSGTISFIFNHLAEGRTFSSLVLEAKRRGYTEPDPRDDLSMRDIARKTLILAREAGFTMEQDSIEIEALMSSSIEQAETVDACLALLPTMDTAIERRRREAAACGQVLRYVSTITEDGAHLLLGGYGPESPFYSLTGTDNMVVITTERYRENPLIIRGPGAGAAVTAGGVFADILKTAESYL